MMEKMDPMKKALQMRRGQGLDIKILVGEPEEDKKTDLAPTPEMQKEAVAEGEMPMDEMHEQMMGEMDDADKMDMMNRKPRSLGERARQMAMMKMDKK